MSEKEFSKNGNIPHVPKDQTVEAELLPPDNDAEGQEAELHPVEAELLPPDNAGEAEGQEAELRPVEAELSPPDRAEAEGQEAELQAVETELSPSKNKSQRQKAGFYSIEAILSRPRNDNVEAGQKAELHQIEAESSRSENDNAVPGKQKAGLHSVEAELSPPKNKAEIERLKKAGIHPIEAILWPPRNDHSEETEGHDVEHHEIETESKGSDHGSSLEGAAGGIINCSCGDVHFSPGARIQSGKEDIFRKFFSDEYDQAKAPILGRQRHPAQKQRPRHRHVSEDSKLSDQNPLGCLQDEGTSSGAVLNQAGAIIGKYIPKEEIPEYARFGTEFGQSLPLIPTNEGSERSIGSISTAPIGEVYGGTFSVKSDLSCDSAEFAQRISFASFSSRPPTDGSDNLETSPPPESNSPEDDKEQLSMASDSKNIAHEKPVRQRRSGIVTKPEQIRSKSALAGLSAYAVESQDGELRQRKLSKDTVRSEPLPQRKITKDSSVNSSEQMSLEDEAHYSELSHSLQSYSDVPASDIDAAVHSLEENLGSLKISNIESATVVHTVAMEQDTEASEQDTATANIESVTVAQNVAMQQHTEASEVSEQDPAANIESATVMQNVALKQDTKASESEEKTCEC